MLFDEHIMLYLPYYLSVAIISDEMSITVFVEALQHFFLFLSDTIKCSMVLSFTIKRNIR